MLLALFLFPVALVLPFSQSPQHSFIFCRPSLQNLRSWDKVVWDCENGTCLHHSILDSVPFKSRNRLTLNATLESDDLDIAHLRELKLTS